jgi:ATP adenylyltransferase
MKVLWAPWRMEYILSDQKESGCIFCPGSDRNEDKERLILYMGERSVVIMNRFPYINGHLLVAPIRHVPDLKSLSDDDTLEVMQVVRGSVEILRHVMKADGFNVGLNLGKVAGAGVEEHIHFHIVPRWNGDTNYMTVTGDVRVIPEHIRDTYRKLLPHFEKFKRHSGGVQ